MKQVLCAAALAVSTMSSASAVNHEFNYTMRITSIWVGDEGNVQSATLPQGSVAVDDVGTGSFGYSDSYLDAYNMGYANWGHAMSETYLTGRASLHQFNAGTFAYQSSVSNSYTLWDSYDAHQTADKVTFTAWIDSGSSLEVSFHDATASHLTGTEREDVGTFPLEHYGTFMYRARRSDGIEFGLQGTLLTVGMDGGPMVNLPPLGTPGPIPEPATYAMFGAGALVLLGARRRKAK